MKIRFFETAVLEMEICYGLYRISKGKQLNEEIDVYKEEGSIDEFPMFKSFYKTLDLMPLSHYEKRYIVSLLMSTKIKYSDSSLFQQKRNQSQLSWQKNWKYYIHSKVKKEKNSWKD